MSDSDDNVQEDWDNFVAQVENSANPITHPHSLSPHTVGPNTSTPPISNHSSNVETQGWESFLPSGPAPATACTMPLQQSDFMDRHNTRSQTVSPNTEEWKSFLGSIPAVPKALTISIRTSESEPPTSSSEPPHQDSSGDDYHPSPVPSPVLYNPTGKSSPEEENGDFLNAAGESKVEVAG